MRLQPRGAVQGCTVPGGARLIIHVVARAAAGSTDHCEERPALRWSRLGTSGEPQVKPQAHSPCCCGAGCSARCGAGVRQSACQYFLRQSFILSTHARARHYASIALCFCRSLREGRMSALFNRCNTQNINVLRCLDRCHVSALTWCISLVEWLVSCVRLRTYTDYGLIHNSVRGSKVYCRLGLRKTGKTFVW